MEKQIGLDLYLDIFPNDENKDISVGNHLKKC